MTTKFRPLFPSFLYTPTPTLTAFTGVPISVTRFGDLFHFGQLFKACGNNYFTQIAHILGNFGEGGKIFHYSTEIIYWAAFYWAAFYWAAFYWSPCSCALILGSQQLAGPQHVVIQPQQEVTR